jgi:hypothetical protein
MALNIDERVVWIRTVCGSSGPRTEHQPSTPGALDPLIGALRRVPPPVYNWTDKEPAPLMKHAIVCFCFLLSNPLNAQQPLSNDTIVKLAKAGIEDDVVVGMVNQQPGQYSLSESDVAALKNGGISQKVIAAMIARASSGAKAVGGAITLYDANGIPVQIAVAANAGNPAPIVLPTKTGPIGGVLMSNGQNPQRTVWASLGTGLMVVGNTLSFNTAVVLTDANASAGKPWYCKSPASNPLNVYACSLSAVSALTVYTEGMFLLLNPGANNAAGSSLNVDGVGLVAILQKDGTPLSAGQLIAGQAVWIWYDGANFRVMY